MYSKNDALYGFIMLKRVCPPILSGKKRTSWDEIDDDDDDMLVAGCSTLHPNIDLPSIVPTTTLIQATSSTSSSNGGGGDSEVATYLGYDTIIKLDIDFNIMNQWHQYKLTYPTPSILAKDILTVPAEIIYLGHLAGSSRSDDRG